MLARVSPAWPCVDTRMSSITLLMVCLRPWSSWSCRGGNSQVSVERSVLGGPLGVWRFRMILHKVSSSTAKHHRRDRRAGRRGSVKSVGNVRRRSRARLPTGRCCIRAESKCGSVARAVPVGRCNRREQVLLLAYLYPGRLAARQVFGAPAEVKLALDIGIVRGWTGPRGPTATQQLVSE
jgi:hypothetical protein